jgi:hypothetical protein
MAGIKILSRYTCDVQGCKTKTTDKYCLASGNTKDELLQTLIKANLIADTRYDSGFQAESTRLCKVHANTWSNANINNPTK